VPHGSWSSSPPERTKNSLHIPPERWIESSEERDTTTAGTGRGLGIVPTVGCAPEPEGYQPLPPALTLPCPTLKGQRRVRQPKEPGDTKTQGSTA
jgi:hypothetical protein